LRSRAKGAEATTMDTVVTCIPYKGLGNLTRVLATRLKYGSYYTRGLSFFLREWGTVLVGRASDVIDACLLDEPRTWIFVKRLAAKHRVGSLLDVGANVGGYSIPLSRKLERVVAVEPWPLTYRLLRLNASLNSCGNIKPLNLAVSSARGVARVYFGEGHSGQASLHGSGYHALARTVTLSDLCWSLGPFDLLKIDVEGHELEVFKEFDPASCRSKYMLVETEPSNIARLKATLRAEVVFLEKLVRGDAYNVVFMLP